MQLSFPIEGPVLQALIENHPARWDDLFETIEPMIQEVTAWRKWRFDSSIREDVGQQIRVSIHKTIARGAESDLTYIKPNFLKRIAVQRCIDQQRRNIRLSNRELLPGEEFSEPAASDDFDPVREILDREKALRVRRLVEGIDPKCQEAIARFYFQDQVYNEIAEDLGISVNTVGSRLSKCLSKLRKTLMEHPRLEEDFRAISRST